MPLIRCSNFEKKRTQFEFLCVSNISFARDEPHKINAGFTLERFRIGRLIDEAAAAAVAH